MIFGKWTVVIPTIWKSPMILDLTNQLIQCDEVSEIIIIDNDSRNRKCLSNSEKLKYIEQTTNIYVNPAWNLGVRESKNKNICLCNDDLIFDTGIFSLVNGKLRSNTVIGCHADSFDSLKDASILFSQGHFIGAGWGCVLFFKKSFYVPIPNSIKIWFGDDWIVSTFRFVKSVRFGVLTQMSTSSRLPELSSILDTDKVNFYCKLSSFQLKRIRMLYSPTLEQNRLSGFTSIFLSLFK
jgi:hypothetical protein